MNNFRLCIRQVGHTGTCMSQSTRWKDIDVKVHCGEAFRIPVVKSLYSQTSNNRVHGMYNFMTFYSNLSLAAFVPRADNVARNSSRNIRPT